MLFSTEMTVTHSALQVIVELTVLLLFADTGPTVPLVPLKVNVVGAALPDNASTAPSEDQLPEPAVLGNTVTVTAILHVLLEFATVVLATAQSEDLDQPVLSTLDATDNHTHLCLIFLTLMLVEYVTEPTLLVLDVMVFHSVWFTITVEFVEEMESHVSKFVVPIIAKIAWLMLEVFADGASRPKCVMILSTTLTVTNGSKESQRPATNS